MRPNSRRVRPTGRPLCRIYWKPDRTWKVLSQIVGTDLWGSRAAPATDNHAQASRLKSLALAAFVFLAVLASGLLGSHSRDQSGLMIAGAITSIPRIPGGGGRRRRGRAATSRGSRPTVVADYSRYSSDKQDASSITDQQRKNAEAAAAKGLSISAHYTDQAVSGAKASRDGLNRMLRDAEDGRFTVLYFFSLSRLARDFTLTMVTLQKLVNELGIRVISATEPIDTAVDGWQVLSAIYAAQHERYLKELRAQVLKGLIGVLQTVYSLGDYCFGYKSVDSPDGAKRTIRGIEVPRKVYAVDEDEAGWVLQIFLWFVSEGLSIREIVIRLNERKVPKDHRSTTAEWNRWNVITVLENAKYVTIWPWGETTRVRDAGTGKVHLEQRSDEEVAAMTRSFPYLRIVDDDIFAAAQVRLRENREVLDRFRQANGQLHGSDGSHCQKHPLHLLLECECSRKMYTGGSNNRYFFCPGTLNGQCTIKRQLDRPLAEKLIVQAVLDQFRQNSHWQEAVYTACHEALDEFERQQPADLASIESDLADRRERIDRLVKHMEAEDDPDPAVRGRLRELRQEVAELEVQRQQRLAARASCPDRPSREWVEEELARLEEQLTGEDGELLHEALKAALNGPIAVRLADHPVNKRPYYVANVRISASRLAGALLHLDLEDENPVSTDIQATVHIREQSESERKAAQAWELLQQGLTQREMSPKLGVTKGRVSALMKAVAQLFGEGASVKELIKKFRRPRTEPLYFETFIDPAMERYHQGMLLGDIATELGTHRDLIKAAVAEWHRRHGLPVPDGRTRRISLSHKGRSRTRPRG